MTKPDYAAAEGSAHRLLEKYALNSLPVDLERIFNAFSNLQIKTYTWFAEFHRVTIDDVIEIADSEHGCCWYMSDKCQYMILYNDTIPNIGRIRWTIAHELGHYRLKHNEKSDKTIISRSRLSKHEYDVLEKEANCFARALLAPSSVLVALGRLDVMLISDMCRISFEAAGNVMSFLKKGFEMGRVYTENRLTSLFSKTIFNHVYAHTCTECRSVFASEICYFCPVCGSDSIIKGRSLNNMIYSGFETDENSRVKVCARCENEEVSNQGEYCKVCAAPVVNKCTNIHRDINGYIEWECGTLASGNARYCINCGEETVFFKKGLLKSWNSVIEEERQLAELEAVFAELKV
ncbi:ImmA/IrrE family metallo-endopeptidase [Cohnella suwonensis]|uniref:ImmA/IrrE family metallo-endopeptidase n=1 Tax=Cohnella suwonensis TaxID=696072 RepID=A0ABW0LRE9_9BACL